MQGNSLPRRIEHLRGMYFRDISFMLESLARLGLELKSYPGKLFPHYSNQFIKR